MVRVASRSASLMAGRLPDIRDFGPETLRAATGFVALEKMGPPTQTIPGKFSSSSIATPSLRTRASSRSKSSREVIVDEVIAGMPYRVR